MTDQIQKIVAGLPDLADVTGVWAVADDRLAQGDAVFAADLGIALAKAYGDGTGQMWQYKSVNDYLLRLLATTAGRQNVTQALRLVSSVRADGTKLDRYTASLLAASHPADDLAVAFTGKATEEMRACLVHELVLRGTVVTETPGIAEWATSPHWRDHPLGWLPLTLSDVEDRPSMPSYSARGVSHSMPYDPVGSGDSTIVAGTAGPSAQETTTEATATAMAMAVANWAEESNGHIEARVFDFAEPLDVRSVPSALTALGLECLNGVGDETALSVSACVPTRVWQLLFAAASTDGAYNSGAQGAYGRLAAWQSLAGLSCTPDGGSFREVEARVGECIWHVFTADTQWFYRVAWDIGVAGVAPDHRRLAVLAATDTD
ncbi:DUF6183 family protein [Amycolatopsis japonica]|uniref:DUF6183 family protein n=1 Tax=Amycolatopsis japonica TaxID=208439 RepID=UPI00366E9195